MKATTDVAAVEQVPSASPLAQEPMPGASGSTSKYVGSWSLGQNPVVAMSVQSSGEWPGVAWCPQSRHRDIIPGGLDLMRASDRHGTVAAHTGRAGPAEGSSAVPLHRSRKHKMIAGVCGGIAEWLGWDPTVVRILYVLVSVLSVAFPGIIVYVILWILMPKAAE
jgi:phage shock protein C